MNYKEIYTEDELSGLQEIETNMLKYLGDFCDENEIEYFIIGGTALGAVRHGGFIPWDDDIDVGMTRPNYEKFIKIGKEKIKAPYFMSCRETEPNTPFPYIKLRLDNSRYIEYSNRNIKIHQGIYIDIFPYDNAPDDHDTHIEWFNKLQKLVRLYVLRMTPDYSSKPENFVMHLKAIYSKFRYYLLHLIPADYIYNKLEKLMTKYNDQPTKAIETAFVPKPFTSYGTVETFLPPKEIKFGNIIVKGPRDMDTYLTNEYGDYMTFPPEENRFGHKPYVMELPKDYK